MVDLPRSHHIFFLLRWCTYFVVRGLTVNNLYLNEKNQPPACNLDQFTRIVTVVLPIFLVEVRNGKEMYELPSPASENRKNYQPDVSFQFISTCGGKFFRSKKIKESTCTSTCISLDWLRLVRVMKKSWWNFQGLDEISRTLSLYVSMIPSIFSQRSEWTEIIRCRVDKKSWIPLDSLSLIK